MPADTTPLDDIMEFRSKRKLELLQFRSAMDRLYENITSHSDPERAVLQAKEEIEQSLIQIHRLLRESGISTFFSTLSLYLEFRRSAPIATFLGALGSSAMSLPLGIGAAAGLAVSTVLTFANRQLDASRGLPPELSDFAYLYDTEKHWPSAGSS